MLSKSFGYLKNLYKQPKFFFGFTGKTNDPYTEDSEVYIPDLKPIDVTTKIPTFRVIDIKGNLVSKKHDLTNENKDLFNKIFETMVRLEEMDNFLLMSQRQGRISFYMPSFGEAACVVGSAAALKFEDLIWAQYREQGALLWRGYTIQEFVDQCVGNVRDDTKGRQMPVHYCDASKNWACVSSPLTTQLPQASGAGYGYRVQGLDKISVTYFGEGAASEGDFHSALNFAATLRCQTLFICRNNKYAISTPAKDQYAGDGIAGRGPGYGIRTYRVDGNDAVACYLATKEAREFIIKEKRPALIEFMTYRIGDHSTSDHSVLYRDEGEIESWKSQNNPINRLGQYLRHKGWRDFDEAKDAEFRKSLRKEVTDALKLGTNSEFHGPEALFEDVYDVMTNNLKEQSDELMDHLSRYGDKYKIGGN